MSDQLLIQAQQRRSSRMQTIYRPLILAALALLVLVAGRLVSESLPSWIAVQTVLSLSMFLSVVAFGQGLVMLTGGLDLSVPGVIALSASIVAVWVSFMDGNLFVGVLLALGVSLLFGIVNGVLVSVLKAPAFIVTLAMGAVLEGFSLFITYGRKSPESPELLVTLFSGSGKLFGIGIPALLFFVVGIIGFIIQARSRFGRNAYLLGSSLEASRIAGQPVNFIQISMYAVSGFGSGLAGLMLVGFSGNAQLSLGTEWLMPSIAAVLVGGTVIGSGRGFWQATITAGLMLTSITIVIQSTGVPQGWKSVLYGVVVLVALLSTRSDFGRRRRKQISQSPLQGNPPKK